MQKVNKIIKLKYLFASTIASSFETQDYIRPASNLFRLGDRDKSLRAQNGEYGKCGSNWKRISCSLSATTGDVWASVMGW